MPVHKVVMATWAENKRATNKDGGKYRGRTVYAWGVSLVYAVLLHL